MHDTMPQGPTEGASAELASRVDESKRRLLKLLLSGTAVYTMPLMASFSMEGLRVGTPEAMAQTCVSNLFAGTAQLSGADLQVSFSDFDLADCQPGSITVFVAEASVTAVYACQNKAGKFPPGHRPQTVQEDLSVSASCPEMPPVTLTIEPPPATLQCPPGLKVVLVQISYEDITLSIVRDIGTFCAPTVPSSLSATFYNV